MQTEQDVPDVEPVVYEVVSSSQKHWFVTAHRFKATDDTLVFRDNRGTCVAVFRNWESVVKVPVAEEQK